MWLTQSGVGGRSRHGKGVAIHAAQLEVKGGAMITARGQGNVVEDDGQIVGNVVLGSYNRIGRNVTIGGFKGYDRAEIRLGDCNIIHDNTRILIGEHGLSIGDWNVFHNSMLVMGEDRMEIGHNCWFGQHTILDSSGGLFIGNGVRVGMYSQIWTHVASGELIEGCALYATRPTYIEDDVWLVGSCIVGSGLRLARRSICLIGSLLTKDTEPSRVYGGAPACLLETCNLWNEVTMDDKVGMMLAWVEEFARSEGDGTKFTFDSSARLIEVVDDSRRERLIFGVDLDVSAPAPGTTVFDLASKTYTKQLTLLERRFYRFIYNHRARFIPRIGE